MMSTFNDLQSREARLGLTDWRREFRVQVALVAAFGLAMLLAGAALGAVWGYGHAEKKILGSQSGFLPIAHSSGR